MRQHNLRYAVFGLALTAMLITTTACDDGFDSTSPTSANATINTGGSGSIGPDDGRDRDAGDVAGAAAVLLVIDEDCLDNGNEPTGFSDVDVNDNLAELGVRDQLRYFKQNVGRTIELYTGDVGDEGWFALKAIPRTWIAAGPTDNGARNYILAGRGLGSPDRDDDREAYLDKIPDVTPLRATGQTMLVGQIVFAVVYDSDVSINYSPLNGSLKGANLGLVAFRVLDVKERTDGSTGSLPRVTVEILDTDRVRTLPLALIANAPVPQSSSEPYDTKPPRLVSEPRLIPAE